MKKLASFFIGISLLISFKFANAQNQCLDQTFGNAGISIHSFGADTIQPKSIAIQQDGKIVVAGNIIDLQGSDFIIARYLINGDVDTSFGNAGIVRTDFGNNSEDITKKIVIQTDGKLLVAGITQSLGITQIAVMRFLSDGLIDNLFGTNGKVALGNNIISEDMALFNNGKIILCGHHIYTQSWPYIITNYLYQINPNGSIDTTFGANGLISFNDSDPNFGNADRIKRLVIQPDQKILALSNESDAMVLDWEHFLVLRFNTDGTIDSSFANVGYALTDGKPMINSRDLLLQSDGKIIIQGSAGDNADLGLYLSRLNYNGSVDSTFGNNGVVPYNPIIGNNNQQCKSIYYPNGKIFNVGDSYRFWSIADQNFALLVSDSNGSLDSSSCDYGYTIVDIDTNDNDQSIDAALQLDGKIVQLGTTNFNNLIMIRYENSIINSLNDSNKKADTNTQIYPNPANNFITIENGIGFVKITDLSGKIVIQKQVVNPLENIDISELKQGCYFVNSINDNSISNFKLIKK